MPAGKLGLTKLGNIATIQSVMATGIDKNNETTNTKNKMPADNLTPPLSIKRLNGYPYSLM
jgi:hypothetical protein